VVAGEDCGGELLRVGREGGWVWGGVEHFFFVWFWFWFCGVCVGWLCWLVFGWVGEFGRVLFGLVRKVEKDEVAGQVRRLLYLWRWLSI
jgi:hypothetical protein